MSSKTQSASRRKSYPPYSSCAQKGLNIKAETLDQDYCPSSRPDWPKQILPWWTPSNPKEKPPYSYATLIAHAILTSEEGRLTLSDIYLWIADHYTAYSIGAGGWQNSIRHNLSLNKKWFQKVDRRRTQANTGKGSYWTLVSGAEKVFVENLTLEGSQQTKRYGNVTIGSRKKQKNVTPTLRYQNESDSFYSTFRVLENQQRKRSIDSTTSNSSSDNEETNEDEPLCKQRRTTRTYSVDSLFPLDENYTNYCANPLLFTNPPLTSYWPNEDDLFSVNNTLYPSFPHCEFVSMQQVLYS
ncbi:fork head domain-containing protein [Sporodiniella umbellata]|nr:fork head domain-containing protein [Sporodiniella umbellata]